MAGGLLVRIGHNPVSNPCFPINSIGDWTCICGLPYVYAEIEIEIEIDSYPGQLA